MLALIQRFVLDLNPPRVGQRLIATGSRFQRLATAVYFTKYGGTKVSITCTGYLVNRMVAHIIWTAQDFNFYFTPL